MYNNNDNTNINCCCTCGLKKAICLISKLGDLIDSTDKLKVYYSSNLSISNSTLQDSIYPNLVNITGKDKNNNNINLDLCLEYLNAICIKPASNNYQAIINKLNEEYLSILTLRVPCNENCCCKYSFIEYFKYLYTQFDPSKRSVIVGINGIDPIEPIVTEKLTVIHCDHDVVWLLYQKLTDQTLTESNIYLVPLCKIYGIIS